MRGWVPMISTSVSPCLRGSVCEAPEDATHTEAQRHGGTEHFIVLCLLAMAVAFALATTASAHDPKAKNLPPTKSTPDAKAARAAMDAAKIKLAAEGKYACCIAPTCDVCARVNGSCMCAVSVAQGKGACGECFAGWKAGKGAMSGIDKDTVTLSPSSEHAVPETQNCHAPPPELKTARDAINRAKRTMVGEGRFSCCAKQGGCDECAHEGYCGCGTDLAEDLAPAKGTEKKKKATGVCGQCLDSWHRGLGAFGGVDVAEVHLAPMGGAMTMTTLSGGPFRTHGAIGSGTSWLPASSEMHAWHFTPGNWSVMMHGAVRIGVNHQTGPRGVTKAESQNWLMVMAEHDAGPGTLSLRGMFSAEPLTAPPGGFPQLFQTGEEYRGREIVDAQHPHDLFMELAAAWNVPVTENVTLHAYGGVVGEPALGPVAFMHRPSAAENPAAPLGHHWQDSTHITHGVFTGGISFWKMKIEASAFHGREPDVNRADIEMGAIDSWSGRLWFAPNRDWSMQFSHGRLNEPESTEPGDTVRTTASIHHNRVWEDGSWATSVVWGRNDRADGDSNAYLLESTVRFLRRNAIYGRIELADKRHLLEENVYGRAGLEDGHHDDEGDDDHDEPGVSGTLPGFEPSFRVTAFTVGYVRDVYENSQFAIGIGADVTAHAIPDELKTVYGISPMSVKAFIRFRPSTMR